VKLGIRLKLFLVSVALIAISVIVAYVEISAGVEEELTSALREDLAARAGLVAREAERSDAALDDLEAWDVIADSLGASAGARITLVRADGVVLGDSAMSVPGVRTMENHGTRPEIVRALAGERGVAVRKSATFGDTLLYVAVPLARAGRVVGAVRVAGPMASVSRAVGAVERLVALAAVVALVLAGIMSSFAAQSMARIVRELTDVTRRMAGGDLGARANFAGDDELGDLGRALEQLAGSLASSLGDLRAERDLQARILDGMKEGVLVLDRGDHILLRIPRCGRCFSSARATSESC
jgi:two-component system phosphate regulon sensor histidine kinase PhoR